MIQRKQSVYLLLGAAVLSVFFFLDAVLAGPTAASIGWYVPSLIATGALTIILAVVTIFLYEDRRLQQKLVVGAQVLDLMFLVLLLAGMLLAGTLDGMWTGPGGTERAVSAGLPVVTYLFLFLARRGIQSDIEIVRSMDRLR